MKIANSKLGRSALPTLLLVFLVTARCAAQGTSPTSRITQVVDSSQLITLKGNIHPLARPQFDAGPVPDNFQTERMLLVLRRGDDQHAAQRFEVLDHRHALLFDRGVGPRAALKDPVEDGRHRR